VRRRIKDNGLFNSLPITSLQSIVNRSAYELTGEGSTTGLSSQTFFHSQIKPEDLVPKTVKKGPVLPGKPRYARGIVIGKYCDLEQIIAYLQELDLLN